MLIKQIYDPYLSQYAYLIGCPKSGEALIIDAQRDVDRYLDLAKANDLKITAAAETHIHADFLGGVRQLVEQVGGVQGYLSKMGGEDWQYQWAQDHKRVNLLKDGDSFSIGNIHIAALHHPGHTPEHLSFLIEDTSSSHLGRPCLQSVFAADQNNNNHGNRSGSRHRSRRAFSRGVCGSACAGSDQPAPHPNRRRC